MSWPDFMTHLLALDSLSFPWLLLPYSKSLLLKKPAHIPLGRGGTPSHMGVEFGVVSEVQKGGKRENEP